MAKSSGFEKILRGYFGGDSFASIQARLAISPEGAVSYALSLPAAASPLGRPEVSGEMLEPYWMVLARFPDGKKRKEPSQNLLL